MVSRTTISRAPQLVIPEPVVSGPEPVDIDFGDRLNPATGVMRAIALSAVIWLLWAGLIVGAYGLWAWLS